MIHSSLDRVLELAPYVWNHNLGPVGHSKWVRKSMKYNWNQLILRGRPAEQTDAGERREAQRVQAIRASANRLYMRGELARPAQLLMELEMQPSWAS